MLGPLLCDSRRVNESVHADGKARGFPQRKQQPPRNGVAEPLRKEAAKLLKPC